MAKIDVTTIEGYESMTPEQKVAALEGIDLPEPDLKDYVKKNVLDKATSDASSWKKKYQDLLSDDERKKAQEAEELASLRTKVEELTKRETVAKYTANFISQGYNKELAAATAVAMADGDTEKVFANNQKFLEEYAKTIRSEQMKGTPRPEDGAGGTPDYTKQIEEARSRGDNAAVAYYIRLQAQDNNKGD